MTKSLVLALGLVSLASTSAWAGKGSSLGAIKAAIASNSVDAIAAELERSERLVCGGCVAPVRALVDHPDARVRKVAGWWLARRGLRSDLFVEMAMRLAQPDSRKAEAAADVLGGLRNPKSVEPLGAALNNPVFDPGARAAMAAALGRIGDPAAAAPLGLAARDGDPVVRAAALGALRDLRGAPDGTAALPGLADADERVRVEAIYTLAVSRTQLTTAIRATATESLVAMVAGDPSARVRRKAVWALGEIGAPSDRAAPALTAAFRDADPAVRSLAASALAKLGR